MARIDILKQNNSVKNIAKKYKNLSVVHASRGYVNSANFLVIDISFPLCSSEY